MQVQRINKWLKDNPVNCSRGAPMGAASVAVSDQPLHLQELEMVDGAYDRSGTYWGAYSREQGAMYCAFSEDLETCIYVRAHSRSHAKYLIIAHYAVKFKT
jgi:hypothetical protein